MQQQRRRRTEGKNKLLEVKKKGKDTGSYLKVGFVETVDHGNQAAVFASNYVRHTGTH